MRNVRFFLLVKSTSATGVRWWNRTKLHVPCLENFKILASRNTLPHYVRKSKMTQTLNRCDEWVETCRQWWRRRRLQLWIYDYWLQQCCDDDDDNEDNSNSDVIEVQCIEMWMGYMYTHTNQQNTRLQNIQIS